MAKFRIDTDDLQNAIATYKIAIDDIEGAIKEAERAVSVLKSSGWKTNASEAFFENFDSAWKTSIDNRIMVLRHLEGCLEEAKREYDYLCSQASQISSSF